MNDRIEIRGLRAVGANGVNDFEKQIPQTFVVDITMHVDTSVAGVSDDLNDTVSYVDVVALARTIVESGGVDLIETLAHRIAHGVLAIDAVAAVDVSVRKPHAAVGADIDDVAVSIHRSR